MVAGGKTMTEFTQTITYEVCCPSCGDSRVHKAGRRNGQQRYECRGCGKWFRANGTAHRRRYDAELIGATIDEYYSGMSVKQSAENIEHRYDIPEPSKDTLHQWTVDYTDAARYALKDVKANTSGHWVADEMFVYVGGTMCCLWNIMDRQTRYLLACHLTPSNSEEEAIQALRKALAVADRPPDKITTDKLKTYPPAIRKLLPKTRHILSQGVNHWINNNRLERLNGTLRAREKTLRGMHSMDSAQHLLEGLAIDYNYFRKHEALKGRTPAQAAKVDVPFREWADVVRADISVPPEWRKRVTKRGAARVPPEHAARAKAKADKKKEKLYGSGDSKNKSKGRVRGPKAVLPKIAGGHVDRQLPMFPQKVMRGLRPKPPRRNRK